VYLAGSTHGRVYALPLLTYLILRSYSGAQRTLHFPSFFAGDVINDASRWNFKMNCTTKQKLLSICSTIRGLKVKLLSTGWWIHSVSTQWSWNFYIDFLYWTLYSTLFLIIIFKPDNSSKKKVGGFVQIKYSWTSVTISTSRLCVASRNTYANNYFNL